MNEINKNLISKDRSNKIKNKITDYLNLIRFFQPTGTFLLLIPCLIGLTYGCKKNNFCDFDLFYLLIFSLGAFVMRSAGCIINDIFDQDFDRLVKRTKKRPIADKKISNKLALILFFLLILCGLLLTFYLKFKTFLVCLIALILMIFYPLAKRFTNYPQIILGFAFNIGVVVGFIEIYEFITSNLIILYFSLICWTLIYDSAYAFQDLEDDEKIGVKSAAIIFKNKPKFYFILLSIVMHSLIFYVGFNEKLSFHFNIFTSLSLFYHLFLINKNDFFSPAKSISFFKKNIINGLLILSAFVFL
jgi:4-hydroxybenzoate polyprenyl transferase